MNSVASLQGNLQPDHDSGQDYTQDLSTTETANDIGSGLLAIGSPPDCSKPDSVFDMQYSGSLINLTGKLHTGDLRMSVDVPFVPDNHGTETDGHQLQSSDLETSPIDVR